MLTVVLLLWRKPVVTGTSEFNNTVDVDGNAVRTSGGVDKFTIASSTRNAVASGNLTVNGNIDLGSSTSNTLIIKPDRCRR